MILTTRRDSVTHRRTRDKPGGGGDVPAHWTVMYLLQRSPWRGDGPNGITSASLDRPPTTAVPWGMLDSDGESDDDDEFESMSSEGRFTED
ncbi:hypothetical protein EYR40_006193 [Pleurotus pulmonarius]|nr:hypothetical protein EYR36_010816 [Pleurotus pulmonarius]KAF4599104.1 hypothetical protein EYR40_006193 [Pleurotus pulmonarius]